jgi:hypothetical protein
MARGDTIHLDALDVCCGSFLIHDDPDLHGTASGEFHFQFLRYHFVHNRPFTR